MLETYEIKSLERNAIFQRKIAFFLVVRKARAHMKLQSLLERLYFCLWQEGMGSDTNANISL